MVKVGAGAGRLIDMIEMILKKTICEKAARAHVHEGWPVADEFLLPLYVLIELRS